VNSLDFGAGLPSSGSFPLEDELENCGGAFTEFESAGRSFRPAVTASLNVGGVVAIVGGGVGFRGLSQLSIFLDMRAWSLSNKRRHSTRRRLTLGERSPIPPGLDREAV